MLPIIQHCTRIGCPSQDDWSQYGQDFVKYSKHLQVRGQNYVMHTTKLLECLSLSM